MFVFYITSSDMLLLTKSVPLIEYCSSHHALTMCGMSLGNNIIYLIDPMCLQVLMDCLDNLFSFLYSYSVLISQPGHLKQILL